MVAGMISAVSARAEAVTAAVVGQARVWHRVELRLDGVPAVANPFDPDQIRLDATLRSPSGATEEVPAFWYQDYRRRLVEGSEVLEPVGEPGWRLRFTPAEAGEYHMSLAQSLHDGVATDVAESRIEVGSSSDTSRHGWVRVGPDRRYFQTSDGRPLRLIGENVCWPEAGGTYDYDTWFAEMRGSGQNFARLWMAPWALGLEHGPGTLNHYRLDQAWRLDRIFDRASEDGIYLLLCFDHHGMYQVDNKVWGGSNNFWKVNPYNAANGGPCATPNDFFASPAARKLYERRLRYLVARYGYATHLLGWEFFNEIDNVYGPLKPADVLDWHRAMGAWLKRHDPFHHLVTTSLTGGSVRHDIWALPEMDFTQYHSYMDPDPGRRVTEIAQDFTRRFGKPMLIGESGTDAHEWGIAADPYLRGFRQLLWEGALGGSAGTAMTWWWQDVHADRAYVLDAALSKVLREGGWEEGSWTPADIASNGPQPQELGAAIAGAAPFTANLVLNDFRRYRLSGRAVIPNPLAASRASEFLQDYLPGVGSGVSPVAQHITADFADGAKLVFKVGEVGGAAVAVVKVDGRDVLRETLGEAGALRPARIDRTFSVPLTAGRHTIVLDNAGPGWLAFASIRLERVRPCAFAGGWTYEPEAVALRNGGRALLYVVSPHTVYPADALRYCPPTVSGASVTLEHWPAGRVHVRWYDPVTGALKTETTAQSADGKLMLRLPDFNDDLAAIVTP